MISLIYQVKRGGDMAETHEGDRVLRFIRSRRKRLRHEGVQGGVFITESWNIYPGKVNEEDVRQFVEEFATHDDGTGLWSVQIPGLDPIVGEGYRDICTWVIEYLQTEGVEVKAAGKKKKGNR